MTSTNPKYTDYNPKRRWDRVSKPFSLRRWQNPVKKTGTFGKTYLFFTCDECGTKFEGRYCTKCGLEAKDFKRFHTI
jgi:rubrerythrin